MSIPIIPGHTDGGAPTSLLDLWARPTGNYPDELWPADVLEQVVRHPTGWLTVCEHYSTDAGRGGRGCVLTAPGDTEAALAATSWIGHGLGSFSGSEGSADERAAHTRGLRANERDADLEFFVQVQRPAGSPDPVLQLSQPFLWYFDAYPVDSGWAYLNEAGRPQQLVHAQLAREYWTINVRALEFRQFLYACGRDALLQIDCVPRTSDEGFERSTDEFTCEWAHFDFVATSERSLSGGGFSRLLGQYVVPGTQTSRAPRFEDRAAEVTHPGFVFGIDPLTGQPLSHTCDPEQLGT